MTNWSLFLFNYGQKLDYKSMSKRAESHIESIAIERERILEEYARRDTEIKSDLYAPWQSGEILMLAERKRKAALMLHQNGVFPRDEDQCLEIGYGRIGWLGDLISWEVKEANIHGIELDASRAERAKNILPLADLRVGDAVNLPWEDNKFKIVIVSTVFSSILDLRIRNLVAGEITRVLAANGSLLWYDIAVTNPKNHNVKKISRREIKELFPLLKGQIKSVTLAPPIARKIAPVSWVLASILESIPLFHTHLLAVLHKK